MPVRVIASSGANVTVATPEDVKCGESPAYTLPAATKTTLGGVKAGTGLDVTADGVMSCTLKEYVLPAATASVLGGIKQGAKLSPVPSDPIVAETIPDDIATLRGLVDQIQKQLAAAGVVAK